MLKYGNKEFRNLEEQVAENQSEIERLKTGVKIEKWLLDITDLADYVTAENVGKYYLVDRDGVNHLYLITRRKNDGLVAVDLGRYPAAEQGPQGVAGEQGPQGPQGERGPQGVQGNDGVRGKTGAGWNSLSTIDASPYTPTFTEQDNDVLVETSADLITNEGTADEETKLISLKFEVPKDTGETYTAGDGIDISAENEISVDVGGGLTTSLGKVVVDNGAGLSISGGKLIVDTSTIASKSYVDTSVSGKQDTLTAGDGIDITGNTITVDDGYGLEMSFGKVRVDTSVIATKGDLNSKENIANKVASISSGSTNDQYPGALCVYNNIKSVLEVAQGKCNTVVLSYNDTISVSSYTHYRKANGDDFSSQEDFETYVGTLGTNRNSAFNSQASFSMIGWSNNDYILVTSYDATSLTYILTKEDIGTGNKFTTGDIVLVTQLNVPDRWVNGNTFEIMETAKVDLSGYVEKQTSDWSNFAYTKSGITRVTSGNNGATIAARASNGQLSATQAIPATDADTVVLTVANYKALDTAKSAVYEHSYTLNYDLTDSQGNRIQMTILSRGIDNSSTAHEISTLADNFANNIDTYRSYIKSSPIFLAGEFTYTPNGGSASTFTINNFCYNLSALNETSNNDVINGYFVVTYNVNGIATPDSCKLYNLVTDQYVNNFILSDTATKM